MAIARLAICALLMVGYNSGQSVSVSSDAHRSADTASFEGCITYSIEVKSLEPGWLTEKELVARMGEAVTRCYMDGDYHWKYTGGKVGEVWYQWRKKREFALLRGDSRLRAIDVTKIIVPLRTLTEIAEEDEILGRRVRKFKLIYEDGTSSVLWTANDLPIDPKYFESYEAAGLKSFYAAAMALPLKYERQTALYTRVENAVRLERIRPDAESFELPDLPVEDWH